MAMNHIERTMAALRFGSPDRLPLEIHDVPGLYDAYGTLDPEAVELVPGAESFDAIRVTYHWTFTGEGLNGAGEPVRRDEWGCRQRVPASDQTAYEVIGKPLADPAAFADYRFPSPSVSDPYFERVRRVIALRYSDRFVCGYIDPGPLLVAFNLMGYDGLLTRLHDDLPQVLSVVRSIVEFQKGLIDRFSDIGVHQVSIIDEFAGTGGLMFSPALFREHFAPVYSEVFEHIRSRGLLAGCLFDGDISAILDDYLSIAPDVIEIMQPNLMGIERWSQALRGRHAVKASVDMMTTLCTGTPEQCAQEARRLVRAFSTVEGGFVPISLRWHRPQYPEQNVAAVAAAFGEF